MLAVCLLSAPAGAAAPPRHLRFDQLSLEQGLPQETALSILQDREGFIWFGTQAGLGRFDGYRVTTFTSRPDDPHSLIDNWVDALYEDEQGRLWVGSRSGLQLYQPATHNFTRYPLPASQSRGAASADMRAIIGDGQGGLWLATGDGLQHFDPASGQFRILHDDAEPGGSKLANDVWALTRDRNGNLWVGSSAGLDRLASGATAFEHFHQVDADPQATPRRNAVRALRVDTGNHLWIGTLGGLSRWTLGGTQVQREHFDQDGFGDEQVNALLTDHNGNLWVGTETRGLLRWDAGRGHFVMHHHERDDIHSLCDNRVISLFQDRAGTLWAGTWYGGISRVDLASGGFDRYVQVEGNTEGLSDNRIRSVYGDTAGIVWLGTSNGLNRLDPVSGTITSIRHVDGDPHSLSDNRVQAIFVDHNGQVWVGTAAGLNRYDRNTGRFEVWHFNGAPGDDTLYSIIADRTGVLWIGTDNGLHRFDPATGAVQTFHHDPTQPDSISPGRVPAVLEDHTGTLWVGAFGGLDRYDPASGRFTHFRHDVADPSSISHDRMGCVFEDRDKVLWICTAQGFNRVEPQANGGIRFRNYTVRDGLIADPVGGIQQDMAGRLWISTTGGLSCFDPVSGTFKNYTSRDGLIDGSYFVNSSFHAGDGLIYFGGISGLTAFRPEDIRDNPYAPAVVVTDVQLFNRSIATGELPDGVELDRPVDTARTLVLPYSQSAFSVEFAALHFAAPGLNTYAYQLEGFDHDWIATTSSKRFASYTNLDPGRYKLHVRAANKDGVWNDAGAVLGIVITPPFWKTLWFRALALLALLGAAYGAYEWRMRSLRYRQQLLTREVASRTAEVVRQKERVERAHRDISLLSEIGRQITASLKQEDIMNTLYQHVNQLMDASVFGVGLYREDKGLIDFDYAVENGRRYPPYSRHMDQPNQMAVWCVSRRQEIFINDLAHDYAPFAGSFHQAEEALQQGGFEDGSQTQTPLAMIYVPLLLKGRVLGCIVVQSYQVNSYHPVHLDMLRTLAAYTAVAFDNADAYAQLQLAQQQLMQQKMMASLGRLVAGIAHEANTPIGNIRTVASLLQEQVDEIGARYGESGMPKAEIAQFLSFLREASAVIERGSVRAIGLISRFKQLAVEPTQASLRRFDATALLELTLRSLLPQLQKRHIQLVLDAEPGLSLTGESERFEQIISNLVENALLHGFEGRDHGQLTIRLHRRDPAAAVLVVSDDGIGMDNQLLDRIFEPYFTTKFGQGGSGLGLYIVHNIVSHLFHGRISVSSAYGKGTTFTIELPVLTEAHKGAAP